MYIIGAIFILIIISETYIDINFIFHRKKDDDNIQFKIKMLFGLLKFKFKIPYIDIIFNRKQIGIETRQEIGTPKREVAEKKGIFSAKNIKKQYIKIKKNAKLYKPVSKYLMTRTKCKYFNWYIEAGAGDAAYSAYLSSILYSIAYGIISLASTYLQFSDVKINVVPDYNRLHFETDLNCIFRIKIVNIIIAGVRLFLIFLKQKIFHKGGVKNE